MLLTLDDLSGQSVNTLSLCEKAGLEGVSRCAVDVVAVLHDAPRGVVRRALRRQQGGTAVLGQELGFLRRRAAGTDHLAGRGQGDPALAHEVVEGGGLELLHGRCDVRRDEIGEHGDRLVVGKARALDVDDEGSLGDLEDVGFLSVGRARLVTLNRRVDLVSGVDEVAHEGGELHGAVDVTRGHDRADAATARQEAAVDQALESLSCRGAGDVQSRSHRQFVLQARVRGQRAGVDELCDGLRNLEVQRHGGGAIQRDVRNVGGVLRGGRCFGHV